MSEGDTVKCTHCKCTGRSSVGTQSTITLVLCIITLKGEGKVLGTAYNECIQCAQFHAHIVLRGRHYFTYVCMCTTATHADTVTFSKPLEIFYYIIMSLALTNMTSLICLYACGTCCSVCT